MPCMSAPTLTRLTAALVLALALALTSTGCKEGKDAKADAEVDLEAAGEKIQQEMAKTRAEVDAALTKLEGHVGAGVVSAETIAYLRGRVSEVPVGRALAVIDDALALIDAGRVSSDNPLAVRLHPGLSGESGELTGLDASELSFTDKDSGATVARISPIIQEHLGSKTDQVAALFEWMLAEPGTRRVELMVTTSTREAGMKLPPPAALHEARERFEETGIADRPVLWLDDKPLTLAGWADRPR